VSLSTSFMASFQFSVSAMFILVSIVGEMDYGA
jgi:hypothetical protein